MNRGNRKFTTAYLAIATAMLCGAPAAIAQEIEAAPVVVAPPQVVQPTPTLEPAMVATPTVAPPPMVPTILAEPAEAERPTVRRTTNKATIQPTQRARTTGVVGAARAGTPASEPTVVNVPAIDGTENIAEALPVAPVAQAQMDQTPASETNITPVADGADNDWMIYGGFAAAFGLAGLGAALARRRRKTRSRDAVAMEPRRVASAPARNMPAMPLAAKPLPVNTFTPVGKPYDRPVAAPIRRPTFADQHLPPVTDPLFAHRPVLAPVTDPLFMQKTVLTSVTDPLFADKPEFAGASTLGSAFDKRRDWPNGQGGEQPPLREFEPAE